MIMDGFKNFMNAIGILAESSKAQYDAYIKVGFSETQAIYLVGKFVQAVTTSANRANSEDYS